MRHPLKYLDISVKVSFCFMPSDFRNVSQASPVCPSGKAACRWRWLWSVGGMILRGENGSTGEKPVVVPLCSPQASHRLPDLSHGTALCCRNETNCPFCGECNSSRVVQPAAYSPCWQANEWCARARWSVGGVPSCGQGDCTPCSLHTVLSEWATARTSEDRLLILGSGKSLFLLQSAQTGARAHPSSHSVGTRDAFLVSKVAGACRWTFTAEVQNERSCNSTPRVPSWRVQGQSHFCGRNRPVVTNCAYRAANRCGVPHDRISHL